VVAPLENEQVGGSVLESYRKISEGLLVGLHNLGIHATTAGKEQSDAGKNPATSACFDAPSAYEITHSGRKLIGSAQARRGGVLLQQGTILVTVDVARLFTALKPPLRQTREEAIRQVSARLTSFEEILGVVVPFERAAQAFIQGFESHFGVSLPESKLSGEEEQLTERLMVEKYTNPDWNFTRQRPVPAFR
jgi:lipoate-protein ligase A